MSIITITRAINAGITRNVQLSELKHEAKIADTKLTLASAALTRMDSHAKRLTEARVQHAMWEASLTPEVKQCYEASLADLQAAIAPPSTSN